MRFTDIFIRRPVLASALSILLFLLGLFCINQLTVRLYPKIEIPTISVTTSYPGASSEVMQGFVTNTIENAIAGVEDVDYIESNSQQGQSTIEIHMNLGANADTALTNIMGKVSAIRDTLPDDIHDPVIKKKSDEEKPAMILAFTSKQMQKQQMTDYLKRVVEPEIEAVNGVAQAQIMGNVFAMRIWLNPKLLAAHALTSSDVVAALKSQNVQAAPGNLKSEYVTVNLNAKTDLDTAEEFNNIVIKDKNGVLTRIKDIGHAELGQQQYDVDAVYKGMPASMVFVELLPTANPLTVINQVNKILPGIEHNLPYDLKAHVAVDTATYIKASIKEVVKAIVEATIIVILVIFCFLGALRSVFIPIITIPLSLVGVCFFMYLLGYSINTLTLLAMVLAIGLVVDDAIVVVENIFRHIEEGLTPAEAAIQGAREISTAVIAMTITLAAVYAPIGFIGGLTGQLFSEFAFTLAGAVIISGFIALTLSPMMCSKLLNRDMMENRLVKLSDNLFNKVKACYLVCLKHVLEIQPIVIIFWFFAILSCVYFWATIPKELAPKEDQGYMQIYAKGPVQANLKYIEKSTQQLAPIYDSFKNMIRSTVIINGIPDNWNALSFILLKPWADRKMSAMVMQKQLQEQLNNIPGMQMMSLLPSALPGGGRMPFGFIVKSTGGYKQLNAISEKLLQAAQQSGLFLFVTSDLDYSQPQFNISINRNQAGLLGVDMSEIASTLGYALGGGRLQQFSMAGRSYDVVSQVPQKFRMNPDDLNNLHVRTTSGKLVPLSSVISFSSNVEPASYNQFQKFNSVEISGVVMPGHTMSEAINFMQNEALGILPKSMSYDYSGKTRQYMQESSRMATTFLLAIIVIFLVLAIQFESYRDPLIILLGSVPMTLFGALLFLSFGFATLNIFTQVGLLTLIGLISKHGILMTNVANELQEKGVSIYDAIVQACGLRLRPIIMTTAAMVFGVIPLLAATGAGAVSRFDIGIVIASGMVIGTLFTLFVVPVLYLNWARIRTKKIEPANP